MSPIHLVVYLLALTSQFEPASAGSFYLAIGCPGGRFISTVEDVQWHNWIDNSPTVYDRKETFLRLPSWLGGLKVMHASQGFLLSGEERLGKWTTVTVPPSVTISMKILDRSIFWPVRLPVQRETKACRDENGNLYVR